MSGLADLRPQGGEPPCYIYKARRGGLGGFSRLRKNSRGVYPTAGQQRTLNQQKQENAKAQNNSLKTYLVHWVFFSPSHRGVVNRPAQAD